MTLIWPADSWLYWLAVSAVVLGLAALIRRRARAGLPGLGRARIGVCVLAAVAVLVGLLPSAVLYVLVVVLERSVTPDEAVWWSGALVLVLAAAVVATWALIGDRSRGRRRCGGCWYDMSATPGLRCPECGREARSERRLFRTRRRWRWAAAAGLVVVGAGAMVVVPRVRDGTWVLYVPRLALVVAMPYLPEGSALQERLWRLGNAEGDWANGWRRDLVLNRARASLDPKAGPTRLAIAISLLTPADVDEATAHQLFELMEDPSRLVQGQALSLAPMLLPRPEDVVPPAMAALDDPVLQMRHTALNALIALGWSRGVAIEAPSRLVEVARADPDATIRGQALVALGGMQLTDEVMAVLQAGLADPQGPVRTGAVRALARFDPDRERAGAMLLRMAEDPHAETANFALLGLATFGPHSDASVQAIARRVDELDVDGAWRYGTGMLMSLMKAPIPLEDRLAVVERAYANTWLKTSAEQAVKSLGAELPAALALLNHQDANRPAGEAGSDNPAVRWRRVARRWIKDTLTRDAMLEGK